MPWGGQSRKSGGGGTKRGEELCKQVMKEQGFLLFLSFKYVKEENNLCVLLI
jgi:hypothetical protein